MKKTIISIVAALTAGLLSMSAQNVVDLIISEVLVENVENIEDDYGERNGWIELFNTSQGTVNFAGCFLTDDPGDLTKYMIPKGDLSTKLGPRQVALFHASGKSGRGTFHTNFQLRRGSTVYLVSNDGRTVIDCILIPEDLPADMSVSKVAFDNKEMQFVTLEKPSVPTPGAKNGSVNTETGSQRIGRTDPHGWVLTLTAVSVVFAALIILWLIFNFTGNVFSGKYRKSGGKASESPKKTAGSGKRGGVPDAETAAAIALALERECGGETHAAIAAALHLYLNDTVHDEESFVLTIRQPASSGWKDKAHTLRRLPR